MSVGFLREFYGAPEARGAHGRDGPERLREEHPRGPRRAALPREVGLHSQQSSMGKAHEMRRASSHRHTPQRHSLNRFDGRICVFKFFEFRGFRP